ncbi:hypothetical protein [Methylobacterium sp. J-070]|uniref:hypothetical protein n=1 Tax=Methylobacterium sp. J-070 TaxID=2836650 RepID=UPI001FBAC4F9|nr:hypothetical protein [Methylobacterium sp. J-070]MCJ2051922.1 hypothetical protein [Methylobacterium sp. J-070]
MGCHSDPKTPHFGTGADAADSQLAAAAPSPTRRRLLTLIASLLSAQPPFASGADPQRSRDRTALDPTPRLFAEVQARLAEHERALQTCDRLEAALVAEFGYPRVRLAEMDNPPGRFAADAETIARYVPPGRRRERCLRVLQQRQARWAEAAQACELMKAQEREEVLFRAVRAAADSLYIVPATTLTGIVLKLGVLLSLEEPGEFARDESPWRQLRLILLDFDAIAAGRGADR